MNIKITFLRDVPPCNLVGRSISDEIVCDILIVHV
jgi:hypothetical protein